MAKYGGWTGTTLRVDLSKRSITKEDTMKYKDYIGGLGLGLKVLWDEVPVGVKAFDPANRIIFAVGPLTGTGTPLSGRVTITSLWPTHPDELPASGHMGGHWGPELKYAGYDAIIIQGKAAKPSWLYINDDVVEIRDAGNMWGNGIFRTTSDIQDIMGPSCHVAAIGQCGETMGRLANIMTGRSHSAGGLGGVMGSKNLKAIGVIGTGAVKIAADKVTWKELVKYQHTILGANSGGVVPSTLQSWQPDGYFATTRWTARDGLMWGAADPPVNVGDCTADGHEQHRTAHPQGLCRLRPRGRRQTHGENRRLSWMSDPLPYLHRRPRSGSLWRLALSGEHLQRQYRCQRDAVQHPEGNGRPTSWRPS